MPSTKIWNGSAWVAPKAYRVWDGSQWKRHVANYWNGSAWVPAIQYRYYVYNAGVWSNGYSLARATNGSASVTDAGGEITLYSGGSSNGWFTLQPMDYTPFTRFYMRTNFAYSGSGVGVEWYAESFATDAVPYRSIAKVHESSPFGVGDRLISLDISGANESARTRIHVDSNEFSNITLKVREMWFE